MLTVLLVEDNDCIRSSTADMLRDMGHSVLEAGSAEQAMPLMHRSPIDVLVADIGLPGMSGDVFAAEARSIQPLIGIVFATGGGGFRSAPSASPGPVLLRKPYDFASLAGAVDAATLGLAR